MTIDFIYNPIAGGYNKHIADIIKANVDEALIGNIFRTDHPNHAYELAKSSSADMVVAVGGDGTVNEVARGLIGTDKVLGIIPCGSGNGLAFSNGIKKDPEEAIRTLLNGTVRTLNYGEVNGQPFFCTCGVGLDAEVSKIFKSSKKRGLQTYVKDTIKLAINYKPSEYSIQIDGRSFNRRAILITVGNANQWGNNAFITPNAKTDDGLLDVTIIKPCSLAAKLTLAAQLFKGTIHTNPNVETYTCRSITITAVEDATGTTSATDTTSATAPTSSVGTTSSADSSSPARTSLTNSTAAPARTIATHYDGDYAPAPGTLSATIGTLSLKMIS